MNHRNLGPLVFFCIEHGLRSPSKAFIRRVLLMSFSTVCYKKHRSTANSGVQNFGRNASLSWQLTTRLFFHSDRSPFYTFYILWGLSLFWSIAVYTVSLLSFAYRTRVTLRTYHLVTIPSRIRHSPDLCKNINFALHACFATVSLSLMRARSYPFQLVLVSTTHIVFGLATSIPVSHETHQRRGFNRKGTLTIRLGNRRRRMLKLQTHIRFLFLTWCRAVIARDFNCERLNSWYFNSFSLSGVLLPRIIQVHTSHLLPGDIILCCYGTLRKFEFTRQTPRSSKVS